MTYINTHIFKFKQNLTTKELGRLVIYTDVITSTNNVIHGHFLRHGLVVIAARQTAGRGYKMSHFCVELCVLQSLKDNEKNFRERKKRLVKSRRMCLLLSSAFS